MDYESPLELSEDEVEETVVDVSSSSSTTESEEKEKEKEKENENENASESERDKSEALEDQDGNDGADMDGVEGKVDPKLVKLELETKMDVGPLPEKCKNQVPCCVGVDEAGRGPVLGSLVYGAAYWPISEQEEISGLGFDDSKKLTGQQRDKMYETIEKETDRIGHVICDLPAEYISTMMMLRSPVSLNEISYVAAIGMIRQIVDLGVNVAEIYVDAVGDCDKYKARLEKEFPFAQVTVKPKADSIYKVVGAASIFAKVTRDKQLMNWTFREEYDSRGFPLRGCKRRKFTKAECSGYPGDANTVKWLHDNSEYVFGFPSIVRHSWKTTRVLYGEDIQDLGAAERKIAERDRKELNYPSFCKVEWEKLEDQGLTKLSAFMQTAKRAKFFQERRMQNVSTFGF